MIEKQGLCHSELMNLKKLWNLANFEQKEKIQGFSTQFKEKTLSKSKSIKIEQNWRKNPKNKTNCVTTK